MEPGRGTGPPGEPLPELPRALDPCLAVPRRDVGLTSNERR